MCLENKVWIFHHNDADGFAAAAILGSEYYHVVIETDSHSRLVYDENVEFIPVNYDKPIDFSQIEEDDEVWILDYSLGRKDDLKAIDDLYERFGTELKFTWIDHHETALQSISESKGLKGFLNTRGGVFVTEDFEQAGCALMWIYLEIGNRAFNMNYHQSYLAESMDLDNSHIDPIVEAFAAIMKAAPKWVRWTADHDIFSGLYEESHTFSAGVYHKGLKEVYLDRENVDSFINLMTIENIGKCVSDADIDEFTDALSSHIRDSVSRVTEDIYKLGKQVVEIRNGLYRKTLYNAFEISVEIQVSKEFIDPNNDMHFVYNKVGSMGNELTDYKANIICLNGFGNSEAFLDEYEEYDAVILFGFDGENVKYSIYSKKSSTFPCNLLALWGKKVFGISGGGHEHAAGFYSDCLVFFKDHHYVLTDMKVAESYKKEKN